MRRRLLLSSIAAAAFVWSAAAGAQETEVPPEETPARAAEAQPARGEQPASDKPAPEQPAPATSGPAKAAPTAAGSEEPAAVTYANRLKFESADGAYSLRVNSRVQVLYRFFQPDGSLANEAVESEFLVKRARLTLSGNAYGHKLRYKVEAELAGESANGGYELKDWLLDWALHTVKALDRDGRALDDSAPVARLFLRAGQFKAPYNRERMVSSDRLQLVDRSLTDERFNVDRQVGVMLYGDVMDRFYFAGGLFNGSRPPPNPSSNDANGHMGVVRLGISPTGGNPFVQSASGRRGDAHLDIGVAAYFDSDPGGLGGEDIGYVLDVSLRGERFSLMGEWHGRRMVRTGSALDERGWVVQTGYLVSPSVEIAVRIGGLDLNEDINDWRFEYRAGLTFFLGEDDVGHRYKVQADLGYLDNQEVDRQDFESRVQLTVSF